MGVASNNRLITKQSNACFLTHLDFVLSNYKLNS
jgi:hypothetical protein